LLADMHSTVPRSTEIKPAAERIAASLPIIICFSPGSQ